MSFSDIFTSKGILKELAFRIRRARIDYPMTQKELAERSGVLIIPGDQPMR